MPLMQVARISSEKSLAEGRAAGNQDACRDRMQLGMLVKPLSFAWLRTPKAVRKHALEERLSVGPQLLHPAMAAVHCALEGGRALSASIPTALHGALRQCGW